MDHLEILELKDDAPLNIPINTVTEVTVHFDISPSKLLAFANILCIVVTFRVSQDEITPLKLDASENILLMSRTFAVSHLFKFWLNDVAPENISDMSVARLTSQSPMFSLNLPTWWLRCREKSPEKSSTCDTSQVPMGHPYILAATESDLELLR